jgi:hypothetical protein
VGKLFDNVVAAVESDRFVVSWHADERCEEREISAWQLAAGIANARLLRERPRSKPNPSVVIQHRLVDGKEVEAVWSWLTESKRAMLVTLYFRD